MKRHLQEYFSHLCASRLRCQPQHAQERTAIGDWSPTETLAEHDISRLRTRERKETQWPVFS